MSTVIAWMGLTLAAVALVASLWALATIHGILQEMITDRRRIKNLTVRVEDLEDPASLLRTISRQVHRQTQHATPPQEPQP